MREMNEKRNRSEEEGIEEYGKKMKNRRREEYSIR
jgi:hypothetical protein